MRSLTELTGAAALLVAMCTCAASEPDALRVCADPNSMPFSNKDGAGFENKLAELVARKLGRPLSYTWWAQRRGFIRHTLKAGSCDLVIGVPKGYDPVATTQPYYRSTYVFVSRADHHLDLSSIEDPRLHHLKIGVHLIGDDGTNTPPAHALGAQGIVANVVGYMIYGDYRQPDPPMALIEAVEKGDIDVAAVWGPLAGYAAQHARVPLQVTPIEAGDRFAPLRFQFSIAMGVRHGDKALQDKLDAVISDDRPQIEALLKDYGVPLVAMPAKAASRDKESRDEQ